jgi:hypothetical protein
MGHLALTTLVKSVPLAPPVAPSLAHSSPSRRYSPTGQPTTPSVCDLWTFGPPVGSHLNPIHVAPGGLRAPSYQPANDLWSIVSATYRQSRVADRSPQFKANRRVARDKSHLNMDQRVLRFLAHFFISIPSMYNILPSPTHHNQFSAGDQRIPTYPCPSFVSN